MSIFDTLFAKARETQDEQDETISPASSSAFDSFIQERGGSTKSDKPSFETFLKDRRVNEYTRDAAREADMDINEPINMDANAEAEYTPLHAVDFKEQKKAIMDMLGVDENDEAIFDLSFEKFGGFRNYLSRMYTPARRVQANVARYARNAELPSFIPGLGNLEITSSMLGGDFPGMRGKGIKPVAQARDVAQEVQAQVTGAIASAPLDPTTYAYLGAASFPSAITRAVLGSGVGVLGVYSRFPEAKAPAMAGGAALGGLAGALFPTRGMLPKTKEMSSMKRSIENLLYSRNADIKSAEIEAAMFVKQLDKLTPIEREALTFMVEGSNVPAKLGRQDIVNVIAERGDILRPTAKIVREYLDDAHKFLAETYGDDIGFVESYMPRMWDLPNKASRDTAHTWFTTKTPHIRKRVIGTLEEGVELGLKPKTLDAKELILAYDSMRIKGAANMNFSNILKSLKDQNGNPLIMRIDKAPQDWVTFTHPALSRAIGHKVKADSGNMLMIQKLPVKIHPEIAKEVNTVLGSKFSGDVIKSLETINAFAKKSQLSLSLFHAVALTESAIAAGIGGKAIGLWNPYRIYRALKHNDMPSLDPKNLEVFKDGVTHGLNIGALTDVQVGAVRNALKTAELRTKGLPVLGKAAKGVRTFNDLWDKGLWDYYHNALKLYAYEHLTQKALQGKFVRDLANNASQQAIKREVAGFVNDTFGGQTWELLGTSPKMLQAGHWTFLAPDWTVSTVRQALAPTGLFARAPETAALRAAMGKDFWIRAGYSIYGTANVLNYAMRKAFSKEGEGRFMWDNAPGHETHIFLGYNDDGTEQYLRWGKQFREVMEFFDSPLAKVGGKLSPGVRQAVIQLTGRSPGSEYDEGFTGMNFYESIPLRTVSALGGGFMPFSIGTLTRSKHPLSFAFPISKGMTPYKTRELFEKAIIMNDDDEIRRIYYHALQNNVDADKMFTQAFSNVETEGKRPAREDARKIHTELKGLPPNKQAERYQEYLDNGMITPEVEEYLNKLSINDARVIEQKNLFDIP